MRSGNDAGVECGIVLVYKVDRLTRSLADFAKLIELFDAHGVSFVSVTQSFNTSSSMGRLTLNVLLSFCPLTQLLLERSLATTKMEQTSTLAGACTAACNQDEVLVTAYCGCGRTAVTLVSERSVSCPARRTATSPLVAVCAKVQAQ
jgi:hypothetical protein